MLNGSGEGATGKSMDRKERFGMAERMISIGFRANAKDPHLEAGDLFIRSTVSQQHSPSRHRCH